MRCQCCGAWVDDQSSLFQNMMIQHGQPANATIEMAMRAAMLAQRQFEVNQILGNQDLNQPGLNFNDLSLSQRPTQWNGDEFANRGISR